MNSQPSPRTQVRRLPDRGRYDEETIHGILDAAFLCHVSFVVDGQPFTIPTLFGRKRNCLYLHGSSASRTMRELQKGIPACVVVTLVDGLVLARSAFHHSINYRSVVAFGTARLVEDPEAKMAALETVSENVIPGRWAEVRAPAPVELKATAVIEFTIEEASAKVRNGPPKDDEEDYALPVWAGVLPLRTVTGEPRDDGRVVDGVAMPASVERYQKR
ncbi:MAG: pyridoxamine 5'-phosphate oxidase family protein [Acidobacteria bacterium]|nr:pyridoxamine 5'-phosphate oxidase family protein [Acidobacteriota bacterium]